MSWRTNQKTPKLDFIIWKEEFGLNMDRLSYLVTDEGKQGLNPQFRDLLTNHFGF